MYDDSNGTAVAADWLQMLAAQVVLGRERAAALPSQPIAWTPAVGTPGLSVPGGRRRVDDQLLRLSDVSAEYVFCSLEACSIGKPNRVI